MKYKGVEIRTRGANKKYPELDDLDYICKRLEMPNGLCITELAKELGVPQNSIRHRLYKYVDPEWIETKLVKARKYHNRDSSPRKVQG